MPYLIKATVASDEVHDLSSFLRALKKDVGEELAWDIKEPTPVVPGASRADSWHEIAIEFVALGTAGVTALAQILKNYWLSKRKRIRLVDMTQGKIVEYVGADPELEKKILEIAHFTKE